MSILDGMSQEEIAHLISLGANMERFAEHAELLRREALPPNVVSGRVTPPRPAQIVWAPTDNVEWRNELLRVGTAALRQGKVGVILLNGGMASRFGGRVKGVVDALPGRSFLQLKAEGFTAHLRQGDPQPPVLIMNSLHTDGATSAHLDRHGWFGLQQERTMLFLQSALPHLRADGTLYRNADGELSVYGPGHGDLLPSLQRAGAIEWLRAHGVELVLMSNVDNLGATLDPVIVGQCLLSLRQMMVEVAVKDTNDVGGAPVNVDGRLCVLEDYALPHGFDRSALPVFNTNTLWFTPDALERPLDLRWYRAGKTLADATPVVQFEALIGQASWFLNTGYLGVDRATRFLPVKTPEDLVQMQPLLTRLFDRRGAA